MGVEAFLVVVVVVVFLGVLLSDVGEWQNEVFVGMIVMVAGGQTQLRSRTFYPLGLMSMYFLQKLAAE